MLKLLALLYALAANLLFVAVYVYFIGFIGNVVVPKSIDSGLGGATMPALLVNVALLAAFALQHTVMARTGFKQALARYLPDYTGYFSRHCEERSDEAIHSFFGPRDGLLRLRSQ